MLLTIEIAGKDGRVDDARSLAGGAQEEADAVIAYLQTRFGGAPAHE